MLIGLAGGAVLPVWPSTLLVYLGLRDTARHRVFNTKIRKDQCKSGQLITTLTL